MKTLPGFRVGLVAALGVSAAEVYRLAAIGKIRTIRAGPRGGRIFIPPAELGRLLKEAAGRNSNTIVVNAVRPALPAPELNEPSPLKGKNDEA